MKPLFAALFAAVLLTDQDNLANMLARLHQTMRFSGMRKWERRMNDGRDALLAQVRPNELP